jgi:hypothetical protein
MLQPNVADGVHWVEDAHTNWYLIEDEGRLTVVEAGVPRSWDSLREALRELGRRASDIAALVLTHTHFDHGRTRATSPPSRGRCRTSWSSHARVPSSRRRCGP